MKRSFKSPKEINWILISVVAFKSQIIVHFLFFGFMLQIINQIFFNPLSVKQFYENKPNTSLFYIMWYDIWQTLKKRDRKECFIKGNTKGIWTYNIFISLLRFRRQNTANEKDIKLFASNNKHTAKEKSQPIKACPFTTIINMQH